MLPGLGRRWSEQVWVMIADGSRARALTCRGTLSTSPSETADGRVNPEEAEADDESGC